MNNLNIISKLNFKNTKVGNITTLQDDNKYSNFTWSGQGLLPKIIEENNIKIFKIDRADTRLETPLYTVAQNFSVNNFQVEIDIEFLTLKSENGYCGFTNNRTKWLSFYVRAGFKKGLIATISGIDVSCNYTFEANKRYNIIVTRTDDIYSFIINGESIGFTISPEFTSKIVSPNTYFTLGACGNSNDPSYLENAKIYGLNVSVGPTAKYDHQYTLHGANLISKLNFSNIVLNSVSPSYTCGLEAVTNSNAVWQYDITNPIFNKDSIINNTSYKTVLDNNFTIVSKVYNLNRTNTIDLVNINNKYKVLYTLIKTGAPEPDVIVNEFTKSALDFENGIIDKIPTTVWTKDGTANITQNKLFGNTSFETKALGDALSTNSKIISGGATPFTIEFYALIKGGNNLDVVPLFTKNKNTANGDQGYFLNLNTGLMFNIKYGSWDASSFGINKIKINDINKFTLTYDGSAFRYFLNDNLNAVIGMINSFDISSSDPFRFFRGYIANYPGGQTNTFGIIDNINIFDGVATKVRNYDQYEEFIVIDLAFDGENNSTKIVDNGNMKSQWLVNGSAKLSTVQKFDGFSSLNTQNPSNSVNNYIYTNLDQINVDNTDFTINIDFRLNSYNSDFSSAIVSSKLCNGGNGFAIAVGSLTSDRTLAIALGSETDYTVDIDKRLIGPRIEINKNYNVKVVSKNNILRLYVDNLLVSTKEQLIKTGVNLSLGGGMQVGRGGIASNLNNINIWNASCDGYIKNFKIYKGIAIFPEDTKCKIQLDFDNNVNDNYNNSTWTNGGVTFDQVNSVKGYAAKFNKSSAIIESTSENLNYNTNNFKFELDVNQISPTTSYILSNSRSSNSSGAIWFGVNGQGLWLDFIDKPTNMPAMGIQSQISLNAYYNQVCQRLNNVLMLYYNDVLTSSCILNSGTKFNMIDGGKMSIGGSNSSFGVSGSIEGYIDNFKSIRDDFDYTVYQTSSNTIFNIQKNNGIKITHEGTEVKNATYVLNETPSVKNYIIEISSFIPISGIGHITSFKSNTLDYSTLPNDFTYGYSFAIVADKVMFYKGGAQMLL